MTWKHDETISGGWDGADVSLTARAEFITDDLPAGESTVMMDAYVKFIKETQERFARFEEEMQRLYPFPPSED